MTPRKKIPKPAAPAVAFTPVSDLEKRIAVLKLQEVPKREELTHIFARIERQAYGEMREAEERAEARMIEALKLYPEQHLLVLATSEFQFDRFRGKLGSRFGLVRHVGRQGEELRGHRRKHGQWLLVKLPGFDRMFHTRPYHEREMLSRALFGYNT